MASLVGAVGYLHGDQNTEINVLIKKTSRNGLKVAKAGHKSEGRMGMMADRIDGR